MLIANVRPMGISEQSRDLAEYCLKLIQESVQGLMKNVGPIGISELPMKSLLRTA